MLTGKSGESCPRRLFFFFIKINVILNDVPYIFMFHNIFLILFLKMCLDLPQRRRYTWWKENKIETHPIAINSDKFSSRFKIFFPFDFIFRISNNSLWKKKREMWKREKKNSIQEEGKKKVKRSLKEFVESFFLKDQTNPTTSDRERFQETPEKHWKGGETSPPISIETEISIAFFYTHYMLYNKVFFKF